MVLDVIKVEDGCTFDRFCGLAVDLLALDSVNISNICYHKVAVCITGHEFNPFSSTFIDGLSCLVYQSSILEGNISMLVISRFYTN